MFPAVKILISIFGLLFQCSCLFCCRISHPKLPWASHSRLLQLQLTWTELGWSVASPNISVSVVIFLGLVTQGKEGTRNLFLCQSSSFPGSSQCNGKENPKGNAEVFAGGSQARARRWSRDTSTLPCVWHWHTPPPLWDWKFRALQRLEGKKKKEILVVLISNRKWYIFFLKFFTACKWKGHTAEKQNCFSLPLFRFLLWAFIPILQIKIPQSCNESGFWRNGS